MAKGIPSLTTPFTRHGFAVTVLIAGQAPAETRALELGRINAAEIGEWSLTKSRRRLRLRLDQLPAPNRLDVSWPPPGTAIQIGSETLTVDGVHYSDGEVADVLVR